ncbi:ThuA domain-containing protein [Thalassoglobus polymorphus]|uniref:Trehalose utilization n=1 Tax=Thalassoglobus polymorphus TaxID=2527994 RepID=A0A517QNC0_9PLAN|nr:ThuA domain-containing protein [Thalassoglobus polymorphus]QDT33129.1 Trehalose utilization [Thalassoglobus polymorphus]
MIFLRVTTLLAMLGLATSSGIAADMKALIIDGQNNHAAWPKTTVMMKQYLEETGLFDVDIARSKFTWKGEDLLKKYPLEGVETVAVKQPQTDPDFKPDFSKYDVVISNFGYGAAPWPKETQQAFVDFVRNGGGLVIVHAANNSFGDWQEYNQMIGIGGWGNRDEKTGPYIYLDENGKKVIDKSPGKGGHHGSQHEFSVVVRDPSHPITEGMPAEWMHAKDELYDMLRGPGQNMQILATAFASPEYGGSGRHEPMLMTIEFGKGKIFHTPLGHADYSQECVGFKVSLQRGTEWAASGKVTQKIPTNFPTAENVSSETFKK